MQQLFIEVSLEQPEFAMPFPLPPVSRETTARLETFVAGLARWRHITNLIAENSFADVWTRHIADCQQLLPLAPDAKTWLDMGSGAGFPGLVIAIHLADTPGTQVHLVESDQRKCAFLREIARSAGAPAHVHAVRMESLRREHLPRIEAVTARAFAPLPETLSRARPWLEAGAIGIFPRGRTGKAQLRELSDAAEFSFDSIASKLDPIATILRVRRIGP